MSGLTMARIHTHYDNLKVARNAPPEVIRAAYKTLSQKYHPDRNPDSPNAIRIIQMINLAYEVLSDPAKRQEHDEWISRSEADGKEAKGNTPFHFPGPADNTAKPVRRRRRSHRHGARYWPVLRTPKLVEKARMMIDRFSRYLFRKV